MSSDYKKLPDIALLRTALSYDPLSGSFTWIAARSGHSAGRVARHSGTSPYAIIKIFGEAYQAHRIAWLYVTGNDPGGDMDHKNLNKRDNRFSNLRLATASQNAANVAVSKRNSSGLKNVCWNKRLGRWIARVQAKGKRKNIGYFSCPGAAYCAVAIETDRLHGEYGRV